MIAGRRGDHALGPFGFAQLRQLVVRAANFEREHRLQVFALEQYLIAEALGQLAGLLQGGFNGHVVDARGEDFFGVLLEQIAH